MNRSITWISSIAMAMAMLGCRMPCTGGMEIDVREGACGHLRCEDPAFGRSLELAETPVVAKTEFGFLRGDVRIRSRRMHDIDFQYKFCWFDANGFEIMPGRGLWQQKTIHGGETVSLAGVSPDSSAVRFTVRLRRVR